MFHLSFKNYQWYSQATYIKIIMINEILLIRQTIGRECKSRRKGEMERERERVKVSIPIPSPFISSQQGLGCLSRWAKPRLHSLRPDNSFVLGQWLHNWYLTVHSHRNFIHLYIWCKIKFCGLPPILWLKFILFRAVFNIVSVI